MTCRAETPHRRSRRRRPQLVPRHFRTIRPGAKGHNVRHSAPRNGGLFGNSPSSSRPGGAPPRRSRVLRVALTFGRCDGASARDRRRTASNSKSVCALRNYRSSQREPCPAEEPSVRWRTRQMRKLLHDQLPWVEVRTCRRNVIKHTCNALHIRRAIGTHRWRDRWPRSTIS